MWKNININTNQIEYETGSATLIRCPNNSEYSGYKFWHPSKLIHPGKHSASVSLGYTDEFTFKLFKNGNGRHNKSEILAKEEIDASDFEEMYGVTNENIASPKVDTETYLKIVEPTPIEIEEKVEECLTNK